MVELVAVTRSLHLLFAALWGGGSLYHGMIVMGSFLNNHAEARRNWWTESKFGPYLGLTSLLTFVFGLWTYFLVGPESYSSGSNAVLGIGMLAGFLGVVVGWAGHLPTAMKLSKAVAENNDHALAVYEAREHKLDKISFVLVALAVLTMATFRMFA